MEIEAAIPRHKLDERRAEQSRAEIREPQLRCIAQILSILRCEVEIVYMREEKQVHVPKRYAFDLEHHRGRRGPLPGGPLLTS